jgi:uncharacterized protein (DUF305 family)
VRRISLVVISLVLAGCGGPTGAAATPDDRAADIKATEFNPTDRAWLEIMIPMDEQLLPALDLAATHSPDPRVRTFAAGAVTSAHSELDQLRALGDQALLPGGNPHAGHRMPGLVDAETLAGLSQRPPAMFDAALLSVVRDSIGQSASLADSEQNAGAQPQARALAAAVATLRATQRAEVTALLDPPG